MADVLPCLAFALPMSTLIAEDRRPVQCYVMGRFGHENGPFWMLAGAVLVLFLSASLYVSKRGAY